MPTPVGLESRNHGQVPRARPVPGRRQSLGCRDRPPTAAVVAIIALVSGKSAPGITTSVALLASVWPRPVVAVDADPAGGDLAIGWLGERRLPYPDRGVLSFAIESARTGAGGPATLDQHLQRVPGVPNCRLLTGFADMTQLRFVTVDGWYRLADELSELSRSGTDVLVDCGRLGTTTPMPLLRAADLVLIAVRPNLRDRGPARSLVGRLRSMVDPEKLGLAVLATTRQGTADVERHLGLYAMVSLPANRRVAMSFSHGARRPVWSSRSRLVRTATHAASLMHVVLNQDRSTAATPADAVRSFDGNRYESKSNG
jgi:hypothetical protein